MIHLVEVWLAMAGAYVRSQAQYRANFLLELLMALVFQLTGLVFIGVLFSRFESLAGWTFAEIAFLYGLRLFVHALRGVVFGNVGRVQGLIRRGEFDRILVRPMPALVHVTAMRVPIGDFASLMGGFALFVIAARLVDVDWSPSALAFLALAILGGCLIEAALQLGCLAIAFRGWNGIALYVAVNDVLNNFGNYPLTIFGSFARFLLTFGLPLAFIAYFPATVVLARTDELSVHPALAYGAPVVGAIWFWLTYVLWRREIGNYQSAGH